MFEKAWEWIKGHPFLSGGLLLGIVVLLFLMGRGNTSAQSSGTGTNAQDYATEVAAATQLQQTQLQAQAAANAQNVQLQETQGAQATQLAIAQLSAQTQQNNNNVTASVDIAQIQADENKSSLQYQLDSNQIAATQAVQSRTIEANLQAANNQFYLQNAEQSYQFTLADQEAQQQHDIESQLISKLPTG